MTKSRFAQFLCDVRRSNEGDILKNLTWYVAPCSKILSYSLKASEVVGFCVQM